MKISVITVCFNAVNEIEETMLSVLGQNYPEVEYIVIDGGSTDGTTDVIKRYADRLAYWSSERDNGIFDGMNKGLKHASGEYVNFMNAGDRFYSPHVISDFFAGRRSCPDFIAGIGMLKKKSKLPLIWEPVREGFRLEEVISGGACNHQSCFIKRELLAEGYPLEYGIIADDLFFLDKVAFGTASYERMLKPVAVYDVSGVSNNKKLADLKCNLRSSFLKKRISELQISELTRKYHSGIFSRRIMRKIKRNFLRLKYFHLLPDSER